MSAITPTTPRANICATTKRNLPIQMRRIVDIATPLKNLLSALVFIALLGLANALATNAGDYAAPTQEEIEADIEQQRINLCDADGWPDDENSKLAFQRACKSEITNFS